jgi:hypothetical protein
MVMVGVVLFGMSFCFELCSSYQAVLPIVVKVVTRSLSFHFV